MILDGPPAVENNIYFILRNYSRSNCYFIINLWQGWKIELRFSPRFRCTFTESSHIFAMIKTNELTTTADFEFAALTSSIDLMCHCSNVRVRYEKILSAHCKGSEVRTKKIASREKSNQIIWHVAREYLLRNDDASVECKSLIRCVSFCVCVCARFILIVLLQSEENTLYCSS